MIKRPMREDRHNVVASPVPWPTAVAVVGLTVSFLLLQGPAIAKLVSDWSFDPNYSHGFLIVPVALYFAWERRARLRAAAWQPSLAGLIIVLGSIATLIAGTLGAELFLTRVSIIGLLAGSVLFVLGRQHLRVLLFPLAFLLLMIPIPSIIFNQITFPLQLLASRFGEWTLQLLSIPVLREGNVIILSNTTLEVAEACSGIRSLVSLLALGLVYGYFSDPRTWIRVAIVMATVPIAIVTNGARVAGTGIAAHYYGPEAALGFFHEFSGWLVFLVAFAILFLAMRVVLMWAPAPATQLDSNPETAAVAPARPTGFGAGRMALVAVCLLAGWIGLERTSRDEVLPPREPLAALPLVLDTWVGRNDPPFAQDVVRVLGVDDYAIRTYFQKGRPTVGLYVGFYASQRQGDAIHSPLNCLPGAGWQPLEQGRTTIDVPSSVSTTPTRPIEVNRVVIGKGKDRLLVLYWYQSRERVVASEYWGKIYTVVDAMKYNRTDAALVRVIVRIPSPTRVEAADTQARAFVRTLFPLLGRHVPA